MESCDWGNFTSAGHAGTVKQSTWKVCSSSQESFILALPFIFLSCNQHLHTFPWTGRSLNWDTWIAKPLLLRTSLPQTKLLQRCSWPKLAGVRVITQESPKSCSSPSSEQTREETPFFCSNRTSNRPKRQLARERLGDFSPTLFIPVLSSSQLEKTLLRRGCHELGTGILIHVGWRQHREQQNKQEMLKEVIKDPCGYPDRQFYALGFLQ